VGEVLWHVTMSLDGFTAGPDGEMEWASEHSAPSALADEVMNATGSILAGCGRYDVATRKYAKTGPDQSPP